MATKRACPIWSCYDISNPKLLKPKPRAAPPPSRLRQVVSGSSLALYAAEAGRRSGEWAPWVARHLPDARLAAEGYHLVAQEAALGLSLAPGALPGGLLAVLTNQRLCVVTCPTRLALLLALLGQWAPPGGGEAAAAECDTRARPAGGDGGVEEAPTGAWGRGPF